MFQTSFSTLIGVSVASLLATSGDITQTWTSPMYPKLYSNDTSDNPLNRPITEEEDSWIGSLINIGAVLGAIPAGRIADKIGRKILLISIAVPHIIAYLMYAFATNVYLFYIGRFINGISLGAGYAILPMYIAEITEDSNRAAMSVTLNTFWTFGNFVPLAIGPYLSVRTFNLILAAFPGAFLLLFLLVGTETPHYLVETGRYSEAEEVIIQLRSCSKEAAEKEVEILQGVFKAHQGSNVLDIFRNPGLRKALIVSLALITLQTFSGITVISYYLQTIFDATGSDLPATISSTFYGTCLFASAVPMSLIIHRMGVKWPLGVSFLGDALSLAALGAFFYVKDATNLDEKSISWLPIASLLAFVLFFNLGLAPLPWTISSQLFPNNVKAISSSAVAGCCWATSFVVAKFFHTFTELMTTAGTFCMFAGVCVFGILFDIIWVPETKGKSFTEIQDLLNNRRRDEKNHFK